MNERKVEEIAVNLLASYKNNARTYPLRGASRAPSKWKKSQVVFRSRFFVDITASYVYGFTSPVLADEHNVILAGQGKKPFCL